VPPVCRQECDKCTRIHISAGHGRCCREYVVGMRNVRAHGVGGNGAKHRLLHRRMYIRGECQYLLAAERHVGACGGRQSTVLSSSRRRRRWPSIVWQWQRCVVHCCTRRQQVHPACRWRLRAACACTCRPPTTPCTRKLAVVELCRAPSSALHTRRRRSCRIRRQCS